MEKLKEKIKILKDALKQLASSIELFKEYEELSDNYPGQKHELLFLATRESMIQRFEYCTDLFWKVLKIYLEDKEKIVIAVSSPRGIIREAVGIRVLSEYESIQAMMMIEDRNKTSHIYHVSMAEHIAKKIPTYYTMIKGIVNRLG